MMQPFWSYYGSAWSKTRSGFYPRPEFDTIIEPFAGAAGYSSHWPDRRIILCDLDAAVVETWRYLIRVTPDEILALPELPEGGDMSTLNVCEEARLLMGWWAGRAKARPVTQVKPWAYNDRELAKGRTWDPVVRARIARQVGRIRHWTIIHGDYRQVPAIRATHFVDPPYKGKAGRRYRCSSTAIDFPALGEWCRALPGQVIALEGAGAEWLPFWHCGRARATSGTSSEVVCVLRDGVVERPQLALEFPCSVEQLKLEVVGGA